MQMILYENINVGLGGIDQTSTTYLYSEREYNKEVCELFIDTEVV